MPNAALKKTVSKNMPINLHVCMGRRCNNSCIFCMEGNDHSYGSVKKFISGQIYKVLRANKGRKKVLFTTGEPTLNPELVRYVRFASAQGSKEISIVSNGRKYADLAYCLDLIRAGVTEFTISVHGDNELIHDTLTRSRGSFAQTAQGLLNLSSLRQTFPIKVAVSHVVNKLNYKFLDRFLAFAKRHFLDEVVLNTVQPRGAKMERHFFALMPRYKDVARKMENILERRGDLLTSRLKTNKRYVSIIDLPLCCSEALIPLIGFCEVPIVADGEGTRRWTVVPFKEKDGRCRECAYSRFCEGVYSSYVRRFGWDEFTAVGK